MDDLISRQVAIDALEWKWAGKAAIDAIKQLPPAPQWVPVSERLPEEQKSYWVCTDKGYQCQCRFTDNVYGLGTGALGWKIVDLPQFHKVIAWMPLPEPFKEKE